MRLPLLRWSCTYRSFTHLRKSSTKPIVKEQSIGTANLRNIGILAHIDAGKTTITERMLFYSGTIGSMGEVHHGNTVTDWMDQERRRGITITSAAVTFLWNKNQFNLVDTPGHIDFTMEVEQTLNVLDGAVVVLDGSAGVEAQTLTVWRQADRYNIPRIIFVNKMDRQDSDIDMCVHSVESKFDIKPVVLQLPLKTNGKLEGIIDILTLEKLVWNQNNYGKTLTRSRISNETDTDLYEDICTRRSKLIDLVSEYDDNLAETIIQSGSLENVSTAAIVQSVRQAIVSQKIVPVLCGSAYKNIGVQPLMDAVVLYLPSPLERNKMFKCFGESLCAKAFKVRHHKHRGPLVYFRIYSGKFVKGQKIYNIQRECSEQTGSLLMAYADEIKEVQEITNGNIAVVTGLKRTFTSDVVTSTATAAGHAKKSLEKHLKKKGPNDDLVANLFGVASRVPEPVFFCSIEPPSHAYASALELALAELTREDPSLRVTFNSETGQTVLAGMGELHLEIIKDRIKIEYKIEVDLGPLQIAYKEAPQISVKETHNVSHKVGNATHHVSVAMSIVPTNTNEASVDALILDKSQESASNLSNMFPKHLLAVKQGVDSALLYGPKLNCPVVGANVVLHGLEVGRGTSETIIIAAVTSCMRKLLMEAQTVLLEPIMAVEIVTSQDYVSKIMADMSRRRANILQVATRGNNRVVYSLMPLSELLGYSTAIRTLTSGTATFSMQFHDYQKMNAVDEAKAVQNAI